MAKAHSTGLVVVLGSMLLAACGTDSPMDVAVTTSGDAREALSHGGLNHGDYYYLSYITANLLAQREHSRLAATYSPSRDIQRYAYNLFGVRNAQLERAQSLANAKGTHVELALTPHQEHRVHKLGRHRDLFDFDHLYLVYVGDNLQNVINTANVAQGGGADDRDVRAFANCLLNPLTTDLQNVDTLMAGGSLDGGAGKWPEDGKGDGTGGVGKDPDQGQQEGGYGCW